MKSLMAQPLTVYFSFYSLNINGFCRSLKDSYVNFFETSVPLTEVCPALVNTGVMGLHSPVSKQGRLSTQNTGIEVTN